MKKSHLKIHIAKILHPKKGRCYLFLVKEDNLFRWIFESGEETGIQDSQVEEAIRLARREWKNQSFQTVKCGYRFTLPERDEIGNNALFHQLESSHKNFNGIYFDEELGHQCIVREASQEALSFLT